MSDTLFTEKLMILYRISKFQRKKSEKTAIYIPYLI